MDPRYQRTIGQREKLSFLDVAIVNKAYCAGLIYNLFPNSSLN
jgi:hypothetical protein